MSEQRAIGVARRLVMTLLALGVHEAVLAPGSRSGPIALALYAADQQDLIRLHVRVDEREAAFLALGLAKASGSPVPVVTTSGTAVANLHPAMLEAQHADVRLLAVTADRPARLRGTGANQATEQRNIFPGVPFTSRVGGLLEALGSSGPAHLNLELDEPLLEPVHWDFSQNTSAFTAVESIGVQTLEQGPLTVVMAGDGSGVEAQLLAEEAGWPLFAEPTSGSRSGRALATYRLLLQHSPLAKQIERVVSFGHSTLSRPVSELFARTDIDIVHVGTQATFPGPAGPRVSFVEGLAVAGANDDRWLGEWERANQSAATAIRDVLENSRPDEHAPYDVARTVAAAIPPDGLLFAGSSNPIRDLDLVAEPWQRHAPTVLANRGLAGIDGNISTAIGAALALEPSRSIAYMGDLTFLHGSNGLLIGPHEPRPDLTIVIASDDGGSIFATLEQGAPEYAEAFERVYATPTGADIEALCRGFQVAYQRVLPADLARALLDAPEGIEVIEVELDRINRREIQTQISEAVRSNCRLRQ